MDSERTIGEVRQISVKPEVEGERGLPKTPVDRASVRRTGLVGDFNRYRHEEAHDVKDNVKAMYRRRGWYASVEQEAEVLKGDTIEELSNKE